MKRTAALAPLALALLAPAVARADNNVFSFEGQYLAPSCGPSFGFTIGAGTKTIDVVASTDVPANDIVLKLLHNGTLVAQQDTLTSPEEIHYATGSDLDPGQYAVLVCPFNGKATVSPSSYAGFVAVSELPLPPIVPALSTGNPVTLFPIPGYKAWDARFSPATVVDPQRTEGEPLVKRDRDGNLWESGPWGFSTNMSFIHRSTNDGREFHLVSTVGLRPDEPPGGGDSDVTLDDQGNAYFADLEGPLTELGTSISNDNGHTWRKNPAAVPQTVVDRQWLAVDNGGSPSAFDNTLFLAFHETAVGTFIYSSPGSQGPSDATGGLVWQNSASLLGPLQALASDAVCAQLRFDPVKREVYYACNEGDHVRVTVGHVEAGQRTGIQYASYNGPKTPGGGEVMSLFPAVATDAVGHVYVAWIDATNFNLYYAFSTDEGVSWSAPVRVNSGAAVTNEFDWAQGGAAGTLALAWYASERIAPGGSDGMPSALNNLGEATKYPWFGYAALVSKADTARPKLAQTRFTPKPMHYGNICNAGFGCTTDLSADRQMADFFGFDLGRDGGLRIVYMESAGGQPPAFFAGTASCQGTTPSNCKILQYRGERPAAGSIEGNTITIDVGLNTGFGAPIDGKTLYGVTAFTFGRSNSVDDLYADVDASEPFDYVLGSDKGGV